MPIPPADLVILPGSKSVRADLAFLRAMAGIARCCGIALRRQADRHLRRHADAGPRVHDPDGREALRAQATAGPARFRHHAGPDKQLRRVTGRLAVGGGSDEIDVDRLAGGAAVDGYESISA
jgi:adenosylcobyric acid synthase